MIDCYGFVAGLNPIGDGRNKPSHVRAASSRKIGTPLRMVASEAKSKSQRVGIIGGGPSGLAAAYFLMKKGYTDVTVLEKEQEVGGKCKTRDYTDGNGTTHNYELGAEYITYSYDTVFEFMNEVQEGWRSAGGISVILGGGKFVEATQLEPLRLMLPAMLRYLWVLLKYHRVVSNPSNAGLDKYPELLQSSSDFVTNRKLDALRGIFLVRQFGYGPFKNFPAIQLLRTVPLPTFYRMLMDEIPLVRNLFRRPIAALADSGTQGLFTKLATYLNDKKQANLGSSAVFTSKGVKTIEPDESGILKVYTNEGEVFHFDKVICALPPNYLAKFMQESLTDYEVELLSRTLFHPYFVGYVEPKTNHLPKKYFQNIGLNDNEPVQFSKRWDDSSIMAYGYNWKDAEEPMDPRYAPELREDLKEYLSDNMNITEFKRMPPGTPWPEYHPHVDIESFRNGYFDELERMQGIRGVFLTGDGMSAESMEYSCRYSKNLVEKHF